MSQTWLVVALVGAGTVAIKAAVEDYRKKLGSEKAPAGEKLTAE